MSSFDSNELLGTGFLIFIKSYIGGLFPSFLRMIFAAASLIGLK